MVVMIVISKVDSIFIAATR